jgi:hypothetical protein
MQGNITKCARQRMMCILVTSKITAITENSKVSASVNYTFESQRRQKKKTSCSL